MDELLLGIDVGTTSLKASLYSYSHKPVASVCYDYTLVTPGDNLVEFPAEEYWRLVCQISRSLTQYSKGHVTALALSCQGETLICLDRSAHPLRNAIVWLDNRAQAEATELKQYFTVQQVYEICGQADMVATWPAAKILWLRRNEPDTFGNTSHFVLLADYLLYRLTGRFMGDSNLWASSALLNIHTNEWWQEMLDYLGLQKNQLPCICHSASPIGCLLPEAAIQMGLSSDCIAVTGALDQTCNMIGCGITQTGSVLETTGSCLAVGAIVDHFISFNPQTPLTCQNTAVPGQYAILLWSQSAGMTLKWFAQKFYPEFSNPEEAYPLINDEVETVPPGSDGLVMLPHLTGAANPEYNSQAAGVFAGIRLVHSRAHFARAIMEAVACMLRRNLDQLRSFGVADHSIFCAGGGASSRIWLEIKADLAQRTMIPIHARDSACHGAAVLAGVGAGIYNNIHWSAPEAASQAICPNSHHHAIYEKTYRNYLQLYEAMCPYFTSSAGG